MDFNLSFFILIMSAVSGGLGVVWAIRRLWWHKYERRADVQDAKLDKMDSKLDFLIGNQRKNDILIGLMIKAIDDIRAAAGRPRNFIEEVRPVVRPKKATPEEIAHLELMQEIQTTMYRVSHYLNPDDPLPMTINPTNPKDMIRMKVRKKETGP